MAEPTWFLSTAESVAGANKRHLALWNGAGSGKTIKVYKITAAPAPVAAVTGLVISLRAVRITAAPTGGVVMAPLAAAAGEIALPAQIEARTAPTNNPAEEALSFGVGTVSGEETQSGLSVPIYEHKIDGSKPIQLPEGRGLNVRQGTLAAAGAVNIVVIFTVV